jgi:hypothetical protein
MKKCAGTGRCLAPIVGVFAPALVALAQDVTPTPQTGGQPVATMVEVIVTGSNIPTAEEIGHSRSIPIAKPTFFGSVRAVPLTLFRSCP